jgi:hypothetical protein
MKERASALSGEEPETKRSEEQRVRSETNEPPSSTAYSPCPISWNQVARMVKG